MNLDIHDILLRYFNTACFSKGDYFFNLISPKISIRKYAGLVIEKYAQFSAKNLESKPNSKNIVVKPYIGENKSVLRMMNLFRIHLQDDLSGAYLHGSLATQEAVAYSDFDALVVVKDSVFNSKSELSRVASKLSSIQKIMHEFDPLQHHGWFIMTEGMLRNYPLDYFPPILFNDSSSLLQNQGLTIEIQFDSNSVDFETPFKQLSESLIIKLNSGYKPSNVFYLKSILSEFMLLPALYLQAKHKKGILKKESFNLAKNDFDTNDWEIMDQVSSIRKNWSYDISTFQKIMLTNKNNTVRKFSRKLAPAIPTNISAKLTPEFYRSISSLTQLMQEKII